MSDWRTLSTRRIPGYRTESPAGFVVSSVRVETNGVHDRVTVWNRGGNAGTLMLRAGDGEVYARALMPAFELEGR
jgi:hypothetical protein